MSEVYRVLLGRIANRHHRDLISPFFRFLSMQGIQPSDIRDEHLPAYVAHCHATKFRPLRNTSIRSLARYVNHYAKTITEWPDVALSVPAALSANDGLPWDQVAAGLRNDIDAVLKRRSRPRKSASGRRLRGCKQSTLDLIERKLKAAGANGGKNRHPARRAYFACSPAASSALGGDHPERFGEIVTAMLPPEHDAPSKLKRRG